METTAPIRPGYRMRLLIIGLAGLGFAAYCFYDGYYAYPRQQTIARKFLEIKEQHPLDYQQVWVDHAKSQGWPHEDPGKPKSDMDIFTQYLMLAVTLPIGLLFGLSYVRSLNRWIRMDDAGLTTSWGQRVTFESVTSLNKERWYTKGIAVVTYRDADAGIERKLVLDDWKFDTEATKAMVDAVQSRLTPEQVVGDQPKPAETEATAEPAQAENAAAQDTPRTPGS